MPVPLLEILKFFLVALVWLFFLRALRAVWAEVRRSKDMPAGPPQRGGGHRPVSLQLRVIQPTSLQGKSYQLRDDMTLGRASSCNVPLEDDNYASNRHARVVIRDGTVWVEDLGSTNGTLVNDAMISSPTALHRGDRLQIGRTVFEVAT